MNTATSAVQGQQASYLETSGTSTNLASTATTSSTSSGSTACTDSSIVTSIKIENTASAEQSNVPVTFGQVFKEGTVLPTDSLVGRLSDGTTIPLQIDVKATHPGGSVRHAVISAVAPTLAASQAQTIQLVKSTSGETAKLSSTPVALTNAGFTAGVSVNLGGQVYTASADALLKSGKYTTWLSGPLVNEWLVSAPLKDANGISHPHLTARFAIRAYSGMEKARVDVTIENNWTYEPAPQNFTYDAQVLVGGKAVYSQAALKHFHHARWRKVFWWGGEPQVHVRHNTNYLIASKAVPNYDTSVVVSEAGLTSLASKWSTANTSPMASGIVLPGMPTTGGRPDIGPLPQWGAMYLLSMDSRAKNITLGVGDLAGSWPIHYRDKNTDQPVSLATYPYMTLLGRGSDSVNPATKINEAFPLCGGDCTTIYQPDSSHQPSMAYLPYLVTGDNYYLEELQFWANYNMIQANPYYREFDKGIMRWDQVRGQAWSLRTLGHAAYITPDSHPLKKYFVDRVGHNLDWYNATYTNGNPNKLGAIDGSGQFAFPPIAYTTASGDKTGLAPWMDDFFTWSVGYLAELGFSKAQPLLAWKAQFPIGRMTAPGYCWIDGAAYALTVRSSSTSPLFATFGEAYLATMRKKDGTPMINSTGAKYLDQACGSQALADWRTQYDKDNKVSRGPWLAGEMDGYAGTTMGYPSNMQPALAVAATSGAPNGQAAWDLFMKRSVKPDYTAAPQWAIVPRK
ncbi:MAG TPA: hypothetical protein VJ654_10635 [Noviherbaspirillum sp.]|nr:hypothetical protein [Noviherbaspirillum sp.]